MQIEAGFTDPLAALLGGRQPGRVRVGLVVPLSGPLGLVGPSALDVALLATHEVNVRGGVHGRYVEPVLVDGGRSPATVADEVGRLSQAGAVDVVVGFHTSDVHRAVAAAVAGRTPYVFTPPHEGGPRSPGVLCTGTDPDDQLAGAVAELTARHRLDRWALVGNDYIWPQAVHASARRHVPAAGAAVVLDRLVPLGQVQGHADRLVDALRRSRADAVLLSLVGRDLVAMHRALRLADLDRRLVRLSGSLEENALLAAGGDRTGTLYAAMSSFARQTDEAHLALVERYESLHGPEAPVLDCYAEGLYDGLRLALRVATAPSPWAPRVRLARADGLELLPLPTPAEVFPFETMRS